MFTTGVDNIDATIGVDALTVDWTVDCTTDWTFVCSTFFCIVVTGFNKTSLTILLSVNFGILEGLIDQVIVETLFIGTLIVFTIGLIFIFGGCFGIVATILFVVCFATLVILFSTLWNVDVTVFETELKKSVYIINYIKKYLC